MTIKIHGAKLSDQAFTIDLGHEEVTWNVTRIQRDADCGLFGPAQRFAIEAMKAPDWSKGNLDRDKVNWIKRQPYILGSPALAIANPSDSLYEILCFCDGQHRMTARWELQLPYFDTFVVPYDRERAYRVTIEMTKALP